MCKERHLAMLRLKLTQHIVKQMEYCVRLVQTTFSFSVGLISLSQYALLNAEEQRFIPWKKENNP